MTKQVKLAYLIRPKTICFKISKKRFKNFKWKFKNKNELILKTKKPYKKTINNVLKKRINRYKKLKMKSNKFKSNMKPN